jgi:hypothetical protein
MHARRLLRLSARPNAKEWAMRRSRHTSEAKGEPRVQPSCQGRTRQSIR